MKKCYIILLLLFVLLGTATLQASAKWGAKSLGEKFRPKREWMQKFSATADVVATNSIAEAINSCDEIVGRNKYCVVEVGSGMSDLPLLISRSKTKLIGTENMDALTSLESGIFFSIGDNTQKVVIEGLNIQGHAVGDEEIYGIVISGENIKNIAILKNNIHDFDSNSNAHGIAVYGTAKSSKRGIANIIVDNNKVHDMRTGSSESIVINGNVRRWEIVNNDIYDVNNIAIDAIGGEGTSPAKTNSQGRVVPGRLDTARYGYIEDNFIENMHTTDNPAYENRESWAAAIYIDGAHHIQILNNVVMNSAWGYEIGAENCVNSRHITMIGNSAEESHFGDLLLGGYAELGFKSDASINCNPNNTNDAHEGHGYVNYLTIKENQFNSQGSEESVTLQYRTTHAIVIQEGVEAINENGKGFARNDANAIKIIEE